MMTTEEWNDKPAGATHPMAVTVKPLVWERGIVDMARPQPGMKYVACSTTPSGCWAWWLEGAENTRNVERDEATAKATAKADYEARIMSAMTTQPADPLSDPRVKALVEALNGCIVAIEHANMADGVCCCGDNMEGHSEPMNCGHSPVDMGEYHAHQVLTAARAALRAIGGEA